MTRETFERELKKLQDEVLVLASMVDSAIERSIEALRNRDLGEEERIIANDANINRKRFDIEERSLLLIATQQPMASDLRFIAAVLSIITDLERMADYAEGIAKITIMLGDEPPIKPLVDIPRMTDITRSMFSRAMDAFVNRDPEAAKKVALEDDLVDNLYNQVYHELLMFMIQDPRTISRATHLTWVAHKLERIADRVTNICERVVFTATGVMEETDAWAKAQK
jgi:phosphate transport system protein